MQNKNASQILARYRNECRSNCQVSADNGDEQAFDHTVTSLNKEKTQILDNVMLHFLSVYVIYHETNISDSSIVAG